MGSKFQKYYFDMVYTPVYDQTVAWIAPYRCFLDTSVGRLSLKNGSSVLIVGAGTGNEILHLVKNNPNSNFTLVAVDLSPRALLRARRKTRQHGQFLEISRMDGHHLAFGDQRFDAVICLHTMDFVEDATAVSQEIFRVLKDEGEFVISYPTGRGSKGLASEIGVSIAENLRRGRLVHAGREAFSAVGAAIAYAPLALSINTLRSTLSRDNISMILESARIKSYCRRSAIMGHF